MVYESCLLHRILVQLMDQSVRRPWQTVALELLSSVISRACTSSCTSPPPGMPRLSANSGYGRKGLDSGRVEK